MACATASMNAGARGWFQRGQDVPRLIRCQQRVIDFGSGAGGVLRDAVNVVEQRRRFDHGAIRAFGLAQCAAPALGRA